MFHIADIFFYLKQSNRLEFCFKSERFCSEIEQLRDLFSVFAAQKSWHGICIFNMTARRKRMELLLSTFNMVMPMFVIVFAGYLLRRFGVLEESVALRLNNLCYRVLLPCSMFRSALTMRFDKAYIWLALFELATIAISVPLLCWVVPKIVPDRRQAGAVVQTCFRTNTAIFGVSLMESICGNENLAPMVVVIATVVLGFNVAATVELTYFSGEKTDGRMSPRKLLYELARNPMILGTAAGLAVNLMGITLPSAVMTPITNLSLCAMPIAMLSVGMRFDLASITSNRRIIAFATAVKLVLMPLVWTSCAYFLGFRDYILCAIFFQQASMTITIAPAMAEAFGCDGKISGEILIVQTGVSCLTMFFGVYLMRFIGVIA